MALSVWELTKGGRRPRRAVLATREAKLALVATVIITLFCAYLMVRASPLALLRRHR